MAPPFIGQAIVVGHTDYQERDRIMRLLSPDLGRVSALAKGARGSRKRHGGALDLGNRVEVTLKQGRGTLRFLEEATLLDGRLGLRDSLERLTLMAYATELCSRFAREEEPEPRLYGLLEMAAVLLEAMSDPPAPAWRLGLEAKALTFAGLAPVLDRCRICGLAPSAPMRFDPQAGGAAHEHCESAGGPLVSLAWLEAAEAARRTPLRDLVDKDLPPGNRELLAHAVEAASGRELRSLSVLRSLEGPPSPG